MKKKIISLFLFLSVFFLVFSSFFEFASAAFMVEAENEVVIIRETGEPARFNVKVVNTGESDDFLIYPTLGLKWRPESKIRIESGETRDIDFEVYIPNNLQRGFSGFFVFDYKVGSEKNGFIDKKGLINVIPIEEAFEISVEPATPWDNYVNISIRNSHDISYEGIKLEIDSDFFESIQTQSFEPFQSKKLSVAIDKTKSVKLEAGIYDVYVSASIGKADFRYRADFKYLEESGLSVRKEIKGTIIRDTIIEKKNEGNVVTSASIVHESNIISRLLTSLSIEPDRVEKKGFLVNYHWNRDLKPDESLLVDVRVNYTLPLLVLIVIAGIVLVFYFIFLNSLNLGKRVSFVKTKGGEFALKVTLRVKTRAGVDGVVLNDHVPHGMQLYEKFGTRPGAIDHNTRRITWNLGRLNAGEERIVSYIIYSKVARVGAFTLPLALASYTQNGQHKHVKSNKTSFVSDSAED